MSDTIYFFAAYAILWVGLAWYMFFISKKQKVLWDEIKILKHRARIQE